MSAMSFSVSEVSGYDGKSTYRDLLPTLDCFMTLSQYFNVNLWRRCQSSAKYLGLYNDLHFMVPVMFFVLCSLFFTVIHLLRFYMPCYCSWSI